MLPVGENAERPPLIKVWDLQIQYLRIEGIALSPENIQLRYGILPLSFLTERYRRTTEHAENILRDIV